MGGGIGPSRYEVLMKELKSAQASDAGYMDSDVVDG